MPTSRFEPSVIKNKIKREEVVQKAKKAKTQAKLQKRLAQAKLEANDPAVKKVRTAQIFYKSLWLILRSQKRLADNIPKTLDNTREFDPSILTNGQNAGSSHIAPEEVAADIATDPFTSYFTTKDPNCPPKVLITTSPKVSKATYDFCDELVGVFPGAEFIQRKKGKGFEIGWIAAWAANRGYKHLFVINEDHKKPSQFPLNCNSNFLSLRPAIDALTLVYLPSGPTAYFKLTSIELTQQIYVGSAVYMSSSKLALNLA